MGSWFSSASPEKIEELQKEMENVVKENKVLQTNIKGLGKDKEVLQTKIGKLTMENDDFKECLKQHAKDSNDFKEYLKQQAKDSNDFKECLKQHAKDSNDFKEYLKQQTKDSIGMKEEILQHQKDIHGLTETVWQMQQRNTNGFVETIPRKSLWQQVKDINVYVKVAVVAIPISLLGLYAIKKYLERNRENSGTYSWRKIHETLTEDSKIKEDLVRTISEIQPRNVTTFNILLLGQAGSGKSSFVNTCFTALLQEGRIIERAVAGGMEGDSITRRLLRYKLEIKLGAEKKDLPVQLFDLRGLLVGDKGVKTEDIKKICKGHIKAGYSINPAEGIKSGDKKYREDPQEEDRMHCIVYVLAADEVGFVKEEVETQLKEITNLFREDTPQLILLTKIDRIGIDDVTQILRDKRVKECCENAATFLNFCVNNVFPQSSYSDEVVPCSNKDLITLFNIKTIIERANDRMNDPVLSDDESVKD